MITFERDTKAKMCSAKVRNRPFGTELSLEVYNCSFGTPNGKQIVNMDCHKENTIPVSVHW